MPESIVQGEPMLLSMWSGPRNVSTALMYAFRQRSDTSVVDEPLYGHYLWTSGAEHPGRDEILAAMDTDGERVVREVLLAAPPTSRPVRFFKNMAHHLHGLDRGFLDRMTHLLLTRDPREMLPSLAQQLSQPTLRDTGYEEQIELMEREERAGRPPVVLDARELLLDPEGVLREACERLGLPFEPAMLRWPPGPRPEDGVWARHWYESVHASTGFAPYRSKTAP
ncbi:MAG: sulfotransferase family protein, partial [Rhodothermales bacterium]